MTLSVCLIVKDEESVLSRCLDCVKSFADEIVIADTGSSDNTAEIAKKYTDRVFDFEWCDDFAAARNFAFSKATCEYVMWLDADDVIEKSDAEKIKKLMENPDFDTAFMLYAAGFDGDAPSLVYYRERIFRRALGVKFKGFVHEAAEPTGRIIYTDITVRHRKERAGDPMRNLSIYLRKLSQGEKLDPRGEFYYGRELYFNGLYTESSAVLEKFLSGDGWVENKIEACTDLFYVYSALGDDGRAYGSVLRSFLYAPPRSEPCCILGARALAQGDLKGAEFWYKTAVSCGADIKSGAFCNTDYSGFIPFMQLCVVYDRLGNYTLAAEYNALAGKIKPRDTRYLHNKRYFSEKLNIKVEND